MGVEFEVGNEMFIVWFSFQIFVFIGFGNYYGLLGIILGLEKNDEVFLLVIKVDLENLLEDLMSRVIKG